MADEYRSDQGTIIPTMFLGMGGTGSRIVDRIASRAARLPNWESQLRPLTHFVSVDTNELDQHKLAHIPPGNRLNIAAFDPFATLIPIARSAGAWVHIDGAFGLFARASRTKRHLVEGVEAADSWATDGHKWLNVPFDCGVAIVRDPQAHRAAMTVNAPYIAAHGAARDQVAARARFRRLCRSARARPTRPRGSGRSMLRPLP